MREHRLTPRRITIVSDAVDAAERLRHGPPVTRDLVYMGSFMPYKNVDLLARGMRLLPDYHLHLLSRVPAAERARLEALAPPGTITFHDGVTDETYIELLRGAAALVTASRAEGFGLPLVESMAQGTPVVVSDMPVFREIGGQAAVYFDPDSPASFASAVRSLEDPAEWSRRSRLSVEAAEGYRWEGSARALLEVLERVHAGPAAAKPE
jgi:glycosyltransferase involved in cell wall biosynthesis